METTDGFAGFRCLDCGEHVDAEVTDGRCPDCEGPLEATYDDEALATAHERLFSDGSDEDSGLARFSAVLPFDADTLVTMAEGDTPLVSCPTLEAETGAGRVLVKDEARNGTGGVRDREMAVAVTAASEAGASDVALPTPGNGGQAAAAYASRAGLDSHSFAPSRCVFANKAMINVHGGDMNVVGGRYDDADAAFAGAVAEEDWHSLAPFDTPYRHEGVKTIAYELVDDLDEAPDAVVVPTGHGIGIVGIYRGFQELARTGTIDEVPRLYAAQAAGCAPVVEAIETDAEAPSAVEHPDTISGPLEIPDPAGGPYAVAAVQETDGGAVAVEDDAMLDAAVSLAQAGVPTSATGGAAIAGLEALAEDGSISAGETVVLVNPTTANREADVLRSHLMKQGI
jgi:threonine synthase